jgi:hypothetical protein
LEYTCLNGRSPHFRQLVYIIGLLSKDSTNVRLQLIYSHSLECTNVPWESLSLLVISIALVNRIPQWPVIKWFLPCSTSIPLFAWLGMYHSRSRRRPWVVRHPIISLSYPGCNGNLFESDIYCHIDPLRIGPWLCYCHGIAPHCIIHGCALLDSWRNRSTLYSQWLYSVSVLSCELWNNMKAQMWIVRCFEHDHQVLWKYRMIWFQKWYACHAGHTLNFMGRTEVLMKIS